MNELLLIVGPLLAAGLAALWPCDRTRPWFLPAAGLAHALLAFGLLLRPPEAPFHAWLGYDPLARAVLPAVSLLFLACSAYGVPYLRLRAERSNRVFVAGFLGALGLLSAAHMARHLGLLWIATEAVTLSAVPLLHFNNTPRAFEATWKYLLVGGTGIAKTMILAACASRRPSVAASGREYRSRAIAPARASLRTGGRSGRPADSGGMSGRDTSRSSSCSFFPRKGLLPVNPS